MDHMSTHHSVVSLGAARVGIWMECVLVAILKNHHKAVDTVLHLPQVEPNNQSLQLLPGLATSLGEPLITVVLFNVHGGLNNLSQESAQYWLIELLYSIVKASMVLALGGSLTTVELSKVGIWPTRQLRGHILRIELHLQPYLKQGPQALECQLQEEGESDGFSQDKVDSLRQVLH
ncbi:hypothetical protein BT96DRAFT_937520 [Gymnopus androsaceus JB14]|uniref:Uncharacterized protein n=1 Tax=Gymnopus androsaceus JB14 TaxID=1447944 RepID=A0A6A4HYU2_9AGAR|nr:hypothetical protein BT96DRAFT_937520 [Gymnopus androsaceus JB14]